MAYKTSSATPGTHEEAGIIPVKARTYAATESNRVTDTMGIGVIRTADFWWVVEDGKPSFPCTTREEAREIAALLMERLNG
jgi:hypothetical protein